MNISLTPPPGRDFPAERLQLRKEHLVSEIYASPPRRLDRRSQRALVVAVAVAVAAVMAAAAYAGYAFTRPATHLESIGCYESASLTANTAVIASSGGSPVAACARIWSNAFPGVEQPTGLTACVLESGAIGVFPARASSADTCTALGIAKLDEGPAAQR